MISTGNDIVALNKTNTDRAKEKIFYSKFLSNKEVELYNNQLYNKIVFEKFIWLAWSIKESVYKFHKRNYPQLFFSPIKIVVEIIEFPVNQQEIFNEQTIVNVSFNKQECFCCSVNFNSKKFFTRSFIYDELIYTVANNKDCFEYIYWGIKKIEQHKYQFQTKAVRNFVIEKLNTIYPKETLCIEKNDVGIPFIKQKENIKISFSHHGNFVAYSFLNSD